MLYPILEMTPKTIKIFVIAFVLIALTGFGYLQLTHFFEIDACLDKGGRWNYEKKVCEMDSNKTVETRYPFCGKPTEHRQVQAR